MESASGRSRWRRTQHGRARRRRNAEAGLTGHSKQTVMTKRRFRTMKRCLLLIPSRYVPASPTHLIIVARGGAHPGPSFRATIQPQGQYLRRRLTVRFDFLHLIRNPRETAGDRLIAAPRSSSPRPNEPHLVSTIEPWQPSIRRRSHTCDERHALITSPNKLASHA